MALFATVYTVAKIAGTVLSLVFGIRKLYRLVRRKLSKRKTHR